MDDEAVLPPVPGEYRARAKRCRVWADRVPATQTEFLAVAAEWEMLADRADQLLRYESQSKRSKD